MIKHLRIENFRCLRKVELDLEPLTVLVGPNGSGKSSLLKALTSLKTPGGDQSDHWNHDPRAVIRIEAELVDGASVKGAIGASLVSGTNHGSQLLQLDLGKLRADVQVSSSQRLNPDGGNLANVFRTLGRPGEEKVARQFSMLVPIFGDVNVKPTPNGTDGFFFTDRWNPAVEYRPAHVSDGTMLVLAYVTVLHQTGAPALLAIEEPERGIHPYLLRELLNLMRRITTGELGAPRTQVVLATHSAELLNFVEPHEVRFLSRSKEDGGVVIESAPVGTPNWSKAFAEYGSSMGGLWLSGNLGGVPGA